jgi:hypothetical protein
VAGSNYKPTTEHRTLVHSLAMIGIPPLHIAAMIGRSLGVLHRYFQKELDRGYTQAVSRVALVAHDMAKSGKYPSMSKFWTNTVGKSLKNIAVNNRESSVTLRFIDTEPPAAGVPYKMDRAGRYVTENSLGSTTSKPIRRTRLPKPSGPGELSNSVPATIEKGGQWQEPN